MKLRITPELFYNEKLSLKIELEHKLEHKQLELKSVKHIKWILIWPITDYTAIDIAEKINKQKK